jgi:hypothetical protein
MSRYTDYVRRLFDQADDRYQQVRTNPVTGGRFMRGLDPLGEQLRLAESVLLARDWFERQRPADAPPFPLTDADRQRIKVDGVAYIVSLFARSLAMRDYEIGGHPEFEEYARGVMAATDLIPDCLANDSVLLKRYPPTPLAGLGAGLVWWPPKPAGRRLWRR